MFENQEKKRKYGNKFFYINLQEIDIEFTAG